jgi:hypothetical protein
MTLRYAQLAQKVLTQGDPSASEAPSNVRARAIVAMENALAVRHTRLRRRRWVAALSVAATIAIASGSAYRLATRRPIALPVANAPSTVEPWIVAQPTGGGATLGTAPLAAGASLAPGSRVVARDDGRVALSLSTGTRLVVEEGGDLTVVEEGLIERFRLERGAVRADVAKLGAGSRFLVVTPDAEVEVHGTSFRVAVVLADPACGAGTTTRVAVTEGQVAVQTASGTALVGPGQSWPPDCIPAAPGPASLGPRPVAAPSRHAPAATPEPPAPAPAVPAWAGNASTLAEHNDLFAQAMEAKRTGQPTVAVERFERLLGRFPASPLAESALAEQVRLLRGREPARAAALAKRYLEKYPSGFARGDAEAALAEAK